MIMTVVTTSYVISLIVKAVPIIERFFEIIISKCSQRLLGLTFDAVCMRFDMAVLTLQ